MQSWVGNVLFGEKRALSTRKYYPQRADMVDQTKSRAHDLSVFQTVPTQITVFIATYKYAVSFQIKGLPVILYKQSLCLN